MTSRLQPAPKVCRAKLIGQSDRRLVRFTGVSSRRSRNLHEASLTASYLHYKSPGEAPVEARKPATIGLTVLAYVVVAFGVQGASHFALFAAHYAAIPIMRAEPVIAMGRSEEHTSELQSHH